MFPKWRTTSTPITLLSLNTRISTLSTSPAKSLRIPAFTVVKSAVEKTLRSAGSHCLRRITTSTHPARVRFAGV
jgi:hypothetical protein